MLESHPASAPALDMGRWQGFGCWRQAGLLQQGAGARAGDLGLARDAHPAHACGHESEPERKRPHPAAGRAARGARAVR